jgi:hypothetical protein
MNTFLELSHILTDIGSTDTGMTFNVHVIAEGDHDLLDLLCKFSRRGENQGLGAFNVHIELEIRRVSWAIMAYLAPD